MLVLGPVNTYNHSVLSSRVVYSSCIGSNMVMGDHREHRWWSCTGAKPIVRVGMGASESMYGSYTVM
jgi:hypothetical protein